MLKIIVPSTTRHSVSRKTFYGPYEYVSLEKKLRSYPTSKVLGRNGRNWSTSSSRRSIEDENAEDLGVKDSVGRHSEKRTMYDMQRAPNLSNRVAWSDDEWNPITHWTLQEDSPHLSFSYHYYNTKHPKNR